jgi:hypothetical protein
LIFHCKLGAGCIKKSREKKQVEGQGNRWALKVGGAAILKDSGEKNIASCETVKTDFFETARPLADSFGTAAYGGKGWSPRIRTHGQQIGD